jgi:putative membrane protein
MRTRFTLLSTAAAVLLLAMPALAQQQQSRDLTPQDRSFVRDAATGGKAEVELGKLAEQNAQSEQVKKFGQKMVQDHSAANQKLEGVARMKGIELPQQLDAEHQQALDRLSKMRGAEFDRTYMQDMVKDHNKDVNEFRKEAQSGKDPDIREFARQTLPTLQQHDQMAKNVNGSLTETGSSRQQR